MPLISTFAGGSALGVRSRGPGTPTYTVTPAAASINEGSALTINVGGTNIVNGTYYFTINHITTASGDFSASSGSFSITSNAGSFTITPTADSSTEGAQTFTVSIRSGSISGTILATSSSITINDTSMTGALAPFDGTMRRSAYIPNGSYVTVTPITLSGSYTIEGWFYYTGTSGPYPILISAQYPPDNVQLFNGGAASTSGAWGYYNNGVDFSGGTISSDTNVWRHFAIVRSGSTVKMYINGTSIATGTDSGALTIGVMGNWGGGGGYTFAGYHSNIRVLDGTALYTGNFSPPAFPISSATSPVPKLFIFHQDTFVDNSPNVYTVTPVGSAAISTTTPP